MIEGEGKAADEAGGEVTVEAADEAGGDAVEKEEAPERQERNTRHLSAKPNEQARISA